MIASPTMVAIDEVFLLAHGNLSLRHSPLIFAALAMGHHFSISAFCNAPRASGVCRARGKTSCASSASRARTLGLAKASVTAAFSLAVIFFGVPLGSQSPCHCEMSNPGNPASSSVGMSGAESSRVFAVTP